MLFYDGQGFMTHAAGIAETAELTGRSVCVGTANQVIVIDDFARTHGLTITVLLRNGTAAAFAAFATGQCDAISADSSALIALRASAPPTPALTILAEVISREPLGPFVREGDDPWRSIVTWTIALLTGAEAEGVSSTNLDTMMTSTNPAIRRMLGVQPGLGAALGLSDDWGRNVLRQTGNYGEIFERNLGAGSPLHLARGLNALWNAGGLHYPLPLR